MVWSLVHEQKYIQKQTHTFIQIGDAKESHFQERNTARQASLHIQPSNWADDEVNKLYDLLCGKHTKSRNPGHTHQAYVRTIGSTDLTHIYLARWQIWAIKDYENWMDFFKNLANIPGFLFPYSIFFASSKMLRAHIARNFDYLPTTYIKQQMSHNIRGNFFRHE